MSTRSRTARSAQNAVAGIVGQLFTTLVGFVVRSVFVAFVGVELLGVQSLLTSIVAVLAVADFGLSGALMYALYGPLNQRDWPTVQSIVKYASRIYLGVSGLSAVCGLAVLPWLDNMVKLDHEPRHLTLYYLLFLANLSASYLMMYRVVLLQADQRVYVAKWLTLGFTALRALAQIWVLVAFKSFFWFLVLQVAFTLANNVAIYLRAGKMYPFLVERVPAKLPSAERRSIMRSVRAMLVYRVSGLILNNTDPVLISTVVGTLALGYYSNYLLIFGSMAMVSESLFQGLIPSVGAHVSELGSDSSRRVFDEITLVAIYLYGLCGVSLLVVASPVIRVWLGAEFQLGNDVVLASVANFYLVGVLWPVYVFRSATGMFRRARYVILVTALLNVVLSVAFGHVFGVSGVLAATVVARLMTAGWFEPWLLIRKYVGGGMWPYLRMHGLGICMWGGVYCLTLGVSAFIPVAGLPAVALQGLFVLAVGSLALWLTFGRTESFRSLALRTRGLLGIGVP